MQWSAAPPRAASAAEVGRRSTASRLGNDILARERRIIGCADHTRDEMVELMEMARRREIDLSRAITRTAVLDDLDRGTSHLRTIVIARERRIIGCADHTRDELVELMEMARRREIDLSRAITRTVVLDDLDRGTSHLRTIVIPSRDAVERRATARGVGGRGRPPLHCFAARE